MKAVFLDWELSDAFYFNNTILVYSYSTVNNYSNISPAIRGPKLNKMLITRSAIAE